MLAVLPSRAACSGWLCIVATGIVCSCCVGAAWAVDEVAGRLITLTSSSTAPNGAWSWFQDARAIIDDSDPANTLLLVSCVSSDQVGSEENGDIDVLWLNIDTAEQGEFELHNRLQADDHDAAALLVRPDGRYLAMYTGHSTDRFSRYRLSTAPHDPTSWEPEQEFRNGAPTTYSNLHHLPADRVGAGRTYNFTRSENFNPNLLVSEDNGSTWAYGGRLLTQGTGRVRPYVRYASDGRRIHFIATEGHPRNYENSLYHGYVEDGVLYDSAGAVVDQDLFDAGAVSPTSLTTVFATGTEFGGTEMRRAWATDIAIDASGRPCAVFTARAEDNDEDHRFFYARFDGAGWTVHEFAKAGGYLYRAENDYTGLAAIDPNSPGTVYVSTNIDPRTDAGLAHYEIFRGRTADGGTAWTWEPITWNSTVDNLRPVAPERRGGDAVLVWMRGNYRSFTSWDTEIVALTKIVPPVSNAAAEDAKAAAIPPALESYQGRTIATTMHYLGAPWLTRESREREEECSRLLKILRVKPGQTVCDMGCGNGFYSLPLAELVEKKGKIIAVDIQPEMLELLKDRAEAKGVKNIECVLGTIVDPKLAKSSIDLVLMVDVYHEFSHPEHMLRAIRRSLKPTGRVALVEFRGEDPDVPIKPLHKMTKAQILKEFPPNGFKLVEEFDALPWQHVMFFQRDDAPAR